MDEETTKRRVNRRHSTAFKAQVLAQCKVKGVSIAAVAKANDLVVSLVNKWISKDRAMGKARITEFTQLPIVQESRPSTNKIADQIHVEINRGALRMTVDWPTSTANIAAAWLHKVIA
jgi:transposase